MKCDLDDDGGGFTVQEAICPFIFCESAAIESLYDSETARATDSFPDHEMITNEMENHLVCSTQMESNDVRKVKTTHFEFPNRPHTGRDENEIHGKPLICTDHYFLNEANVVFNHINFIESQIPDATGSGTNTYTKSSIVVKWYFTVKKEASERIGSAKKKTPAEKLAEAIARKKLTVSKVPP